MTTTVAAPTAPAIARANPPLILIWASDTHPAYTVGMCGMTGFFAVCGASAGDVVDLYPWFNIVKRAGIVSATGTTVAQAAVTNGANGTPTRLTIPTGPLQDGLWLIAVGVSA